MKAALGVNRTLRPLAVQAVIEGRGLQQRRGAVRRVSLAGCELCAQGAHLLHLALPRRIVGEHVGQVPGFITVQLQIRLSFSRRQGFLRPLKAPPQRSFSHVIVARGCCEKKNKFPARRKEAARRPPFCPLLDFRPALCYNQAVSQLLPPQGTSFRQMQNPPLSPSPSGRTGGTNRKVRLSRHADRTRRPLHF